MKLFKGGNVRSDKKEKLIENYPSLMEDDFNEDNKDKLLIHLQQKLGKTKEEMRDIIERL